MQIKSIQNILNMVKEHTGAIISIVIASCLGAGMTVFSTVLSKQIIDYAIAQNYDDCVKYFTVLIINIAFIILFRFFVKQRTEKTKALIEISLKSRIIDAFLYSDYKKTQQFSKGDVQNRLFNDAKIVANTVVNILPVICTTIVQGIGVFIVLWFISYKLSLLAFCACLVLLVFVSVMRKSIKSLHKIMQEKEGVVFDYVREILDKILVIKAFEMNDHILGEFDNKQADHYVARMKKRNVSVISGMSLFLVFELGYLFVIGYGAYCLSQKLLSYGSFVAIIQLLPQVRTPVSNLSSVMPAFYSMLASYERISEITHLTKEETRYTNTSLSYENMSTVVFENVSFKYDNDVVLNDFSCRIDLGKIVLINGRSGIGKSTVLKLLLGIYRIDAGSIYLETKDKKRIEIGKDTRKLFSYVPQGLMLFSGSIFDNCKSVNPACDEDMIINASKIAGAEEFINRLPDGIYTQIGKGGMDLSEGQLQRIAIMRALVCDAHIMLLDEATSALDPETESLILNNIKTLYNKTIIIISHKKAAEKICDDIISI